ncbi:MAG TPA: error-prone DNA polymerase [Acidimicrobiales bacterium]|nr:error-prone DNA polymerase [Acidimicrobiales bacterium]
MGSFNPIVPWSELERRLSGRRAARPGERAVPAGDGGDAPGFSRHRPSYAPPGGIRPPPGAVAYAELHAHSNFSFLDGASSPEELVEEAVRLGLEALALTDHDGCYGVVRFAEAARGFGLPTIFGSELSLPAPGDSRAGERAGAIDPAATHLVVLARGPEGYARLSGAISRAQLAGGAKGRPLFSLPELAGAHGGHWCVLTGCRRGAVPAALERRGPAAAARELARLVDAFGSGNVAVELCDHGAPLDGARNDALAECAARAGLPVVATTNAHYATPGRYPLATALAAVRAKSSLDAIDGWLPPWAGASLRSGAEQARRFKRYPGAIEQTAELGRTLAFDLRLVAPGLPPFPVPPGEDEASFLRFLATEGGRRRYGSRSSPRVPGAWEQVERELAVIVGLGFPGYFLVVWDIVEFCRRSGIFCQGRGSAANSAVCYALGITNVDAVALGLLFERFLSPAREGPPDIDLDIESGRRDEVIAYVYERYGREHAAQVANVITYRPRSAVRDVGRALGYPPGALDAWSRQIGAFAALLPTRPRGQAGKGRPGTGGRPVPEPPVDHDIPDEVLRLAAELEGFPRHLGIHSGGMVICDRPVITVCPVEWARREGRSVLQWDKDDCAAVGLVKFDLLGLGMLEALHRMVDLVASHHEVTVDLATIPQEDAVYDMLCRADSMGVFQVESRAQMATLPRLRPRHFYDLVVEVALIRPGPIQGGSVHPYLRRRNGEEEVAYLHPLLQPALEKTLGVPLFQEQLMQIAIDVAGFSAAEADQLRQAMGAKRSAERMARLQDRLYAGMAERGISDEVADAIYEQLAAFANFGFPESHSVSFAYLVYASAWFKLHYPAAFLAGLLNSQPMGFWSPQSLAADARRHGVVVLRPDVNESATEATLAACPASAGATAVRLGLASVRHVGEECARRIATGAPYESMEDLARRAEPTRPQLEALATAGALGTLAPVARAGRAAVAPGPPASVATGDRRAALWAAGALAGGADRLPGMVVGADAPVLPAMTPTEETAADLWAMGITPDSHPFVHLRGLLDEMGVRSAASLLAGEDTGRVLAAGVVTHRQRPSTAGGTIFLNLEDETGVVNVICSAGLWARYRREASSAPALLVRGRVERSGGALSIAAERVEPLGLPVAVGRSRDFR